MKKNAHLHIVVTTEFLQFLKEQAEKRMLTLAEFCRLKLQENLQIDRIENKIDKILKENENK